MNQSNSFYEDVSSNQQLYVEFLITKDNLGAYRIIRRVSIVSRINSK